MMLRRVGQNRKCSQTWCGEMESLRREVVITQKIILVIPDLEEFFSCGVL